MKKIYVCSLVVGDQEYNKEKALEYTKYVALKCAAIPVVPQIYFPLFLDEFSLTDADFAREARLTLLKDCDELWYFGDGVTKDMVAEILAARERDIPVKHVSEWEMSMQEEIVDDANKQTGIRARMPTFRREG